MNNKGIKNTSTKVVTPPVVSVGQIYSKIDSFEDEHYYFMVCQVNHYMYCLIGLSDGNRWKDPLPMDEFRDMIKEDDFEYLGDKLTTFNTTSRTYTEREFKVIV